MKRTGVVALFVALAVLALAGPAPAADSASLRLNWYLGGLHAPFYLGVERGYYKDEGIDLTINEGRGSARSVQIVGANTDTFGMTDAGSLMLGVAKGVPIRSVFTLLSSSDFAIISLEEHGIKTPRDLEGKSVAVSAGDALTQLFPAVIEANKLNKDRIKLVFMDPPAKPAALMEKKVEALLGGASDQYWLVKYKGFKPTRLMFAEIGVDTVGMTIAAHNDTLKDKPDLVRRFVKATIRSWQAAQQDPTAAAKAAQKVKADLNVASTEDQLRTNLSQLHSKNSQGKAIGYSAPEDWEHTMALLKKYRDLQTDKPPAFFYTNEFMPK
ncbi:MAG: ABC transporter substrate-binding protein [Candidatus Methylomirabilales bacterium]